MVVIDHSIESSSRVVGRLGSAPKAVADARPLRRGGRFLHCDPVPALAVLAVQRVVEDSRIGGRVTGHGDALGGIRRALAPEIHAASRGQRRALLRQSPIASAGYSACGASRERGARRFRCVRRVPPARSELRSRACDTPPGRSSCGRRNRQREDRGLDTHRAWAAVKDPVNTYPRAYPERVAPWSARGARKDSRWVRRWALRLRESAPAPAGALERAARRSKGPP